jgi:hypothetical protein
MVATRPSIGIDPGVSGGLILALDPGNTRSALVVLDGPTVTGAMHGDNASVLAVLAEWEHGPTLVIERIESFGMAVGAEVFETCVWSGRFWQAYGGPVERLTRRDVKLHLCGTSRAKDGNIRQALIDRYGGKDAAIGSKKAPGPLYGIKADLWAALAVGVTYQDRRMTAERAAPGPHQGRG